MPGIFHQAGCCCAGEACVHCVDPTPIRYGAKSNGITWRNLAGPQCDVADNGTPVPNVSGLVPQQEDPCYYFGPTPYPTFYFQVIITEALITVLLHHACPGGVPDDYWQVFHGSVANEGCNEQYVVSQDGTAVYGTGGTVTIKPRVIPA